MMLYVLHVHAAQGNLHNFGVFHTKSTSTNFEAKANNATNRKENGNKKYAAEEGCNTCIHHLIGLTTAIETALPHFRASFLVIV